MSDGRVNRREWLKVLAWTITGLMVGGVAGYSLKVTQMIERKVTSTTTVTNTLFLNLSKSALKPVPRVDGKSVVSIVNGRDVYEMGEKLFN